MVLELDLDFPPGGLVGLVAGAEDDYYDTTLGYKLGVRNYSKGTERVEKERKPSMCFFLSLKRNLLKQ
jgi:hypothetical protein